MYAMKNTLLSGLLLLAAGCTPGAGQKSAQAQQAAVHGAEPEPRAALQQAPSGDEDAGMLPDEYADYYLVVVNSSRNYKALHRDMLRISHRFHISIDTLGRYYNPHTHAIVVPEDDEDEIYRGSYYPRRFESLSLSIENAGYYDAAKKFKEPTQYPAQMILVAGMYAQRERADSLRNVLVEAYPQTFVQKSKIYTGCMH